MMFGGIQRDLALRDAIPLREVLERDIAQLLPAHSEHPFLVALAGLPGTGKSHFARELGKRLPLVVLESDWLRKVMVPWPEYTWGESARLFAACHLLLEEFLDQGRRVVFDATNLTELFRRPLFQIARRASAPAALVRLTAPQETVRRRLAERAAGLHPGDHSDAGWLIYSRMLPHEEAIQRQHLTVDSSNDISPALEEVVRLVQEASGSTSGERPEALG